MQCTFCQYKFSEGDGFKCGYLAATWAEDGETSEAVYDLLEDIGRALSCSGICPWFLAKNHLEDK